MAVDISNLAPNFLSKVNALLECCRRRGYDMRPTAGLRAPAEQAKLWRQSRATEEIAAAVAKLRTQDANYLADVLQGVGPQHGPHVTNALPGLSWHQWGEAVDCMWVVNGQAIWETDVLVNGNNGYMVYAAEAQALGLDAGGLWSSFKDWPHAQLRAGASPLAVGLTMREIDATMRARFG